jgi:hypothetical protein
MKLVPVDPDEIPNLRESHRGRVSYPILKLFLESGQAMVKLDRTGVQQSLQSLSSSINAYVRNHELPVKMFMRRGEIYLMRTDAEEGGSVAKINLDGVGRKKDEVGKAPQALLDEAESIADVDGSEVERRFEEEKGQVTK